MPTLRTHRAGRPALTIVGDGVAPALLDRYLAKTNVKGQQFKPHDPPGDRHNTSEPVYGAEVPRARQVLRQGAHAQRRAVGQPPLRPRPPRRPGGSWCAGRRGVATMSTACPEMPGSSVIATANGSARTGRGHRGRGR